MSAPDRLVRDAEAISFSFLTAKTSNVLQRVLDKRRITGDETAVLENAFRFLQDISDGARFTVQGNFREGANPSRSIAALDVALGPIDALKKLVSHEDNFATFFDELAHAVEQVRNTGSGQGVEAPLQSAKQFFEVLSSWLADELNTRKPLIGSRRDSLM